MSFTHQKFTQDVGSVPVCRRYYRIHIHMHTNYTADVCIVGNASPLELFPFCAELFTVLGSRNLVSWSGHLQAVGTVDLHDASWLCILQQGVTCNVISNFARVYWVLGPSMSAFPKVIWRRNSGGYNTPSMCLHSEIVRMISMEFGFEWYIHLKSSWLAEFTFSSIGPV
jgi:hypothetical protein